MMEVQAAPNLFLLPAYIAFETARATVTYAATHAGVKISATSITLACESAKAVFTIVALALSIRQQNGSLSLQTLWEEINSISAGQQGFGKIKSYLVFAVPSALYLINNILYLIGIEFTTPALLHVAILAKLPLTAVIHHMFIKTQRNMRAWLWLGVLCFGLLTTNISPTFVFEFLGITAKSDLEDKPSFMESFGGVIVGLVIATISSFTSIYTEVVLKANVSFWVAQFWLYILGSFFAAIAFTFWDGSASAIFGSQEDESPKPNKPAETSASSTFVASIAIIVTTTATGLVVANILRQKDNLVKLVGTSASIVTIIVAQCLLFPDLRQSTWTVQTVIGAGLIAVSTWCYHFYKQQPVPSQTTYTAVQPNEELELEEGREEEGEEETQNGFASSKLPIDQSEPQSMEPTPYRITASILLVVFLTVATALFGPRQNNNTLS